MVRVGIQNVAIQLWSEKQQFCFQYCYIHSFISVLFCQYSVLGRFIGSKKLKKIRKISSRNSFLFRKYFNIEWHQKLPKSSHLAPFKFRDTAGQERFRSLCNSYFRRADGAILVYDCSVDRSFLRIRDWIETVKVCWLLWNIPIIHIHK
jgi:GTPase SAR1 family protein